MKIKRLFGLLAILSLGILVFLICKSPSYSIYDEQNFIYNLRLFERIGLNNSFLTQMHNQSPGPLYQIMHYLFRPVVNNSIVGMRLTNLCFFLITLLFTYLILVKKANSFTITGMYFAMPMTWVVAGMALTEVPSMLFSSIFIYFLQKMLSEKYHSKSISYLFLVGAGLSLGLSIVGRTPFLMVLLACPIFLIFENQRFKIILLILISAMFPAYLFMVWHGLVPPDVQSIQSGINPMYLFLSLGYMAFLTFILAHKWFILPKKYFYFTLIFTLLFIILNIIFRFIELEPLKSFSDRYFGSQMKSIYKYAAPGILMGFGLFYLSSCVHHILKNKNDVFFIFNLLAGLLILMSTLKSSAQFSSRYVIQAAPFFLIAYSDYIKLDRKTLILQLGGTLLGILSILGYYKL